MIFWCCVILAVACGALIRAFGTLTVRHIQTVVWATFLTGLISLSTTFIVPTPYIPDTILLFLLLLLMVPACAPIFIAGKFRQRCS